MSERICLRYRKLPDGESLNGHQLACHGARLAFHSESPSDGGLATGDLVEVECGSTLYLGQVEERRGQTCLVSIEHIVDLARLPAIERSWNQTGKAQP